MSWPLADVAPPIAVAAPRRARLPRVTWVLVASAFLCGGLLSAAGFSIGWRHQAQRGSSAESALVSATARTHALSAQLASRAHRARESAARRQRRSRPRTARVARDEAKLGKAVARREAGAGGNRRRSAARSRGDLDR